MTSFMVPRSKRKRTLQSIPDVRRVTTYLIKRYSLHRYRGFLEQTLYEKCESATKGMTMSHSVTIRTQTVTSSSTSVIINTGYLKTWGGLFKLLHVALGIVCVAIIGHRFTTHGGYQYTAELFFLLITTTFMISSFILLVSCLASLSTSSIISKTIFELLYHSIAFGLYLAASLTFIVHVSNMKGYSQYEVLMAAAICGLVNSALYLLSTIVALRTYRGI
ncbi:uncharacterized protein LOC117603392 isoform X2 [Osmia lignaria lignaria]|uniref:uncharacterized protein LOC117603392 isoform X2 n=1 Tax=Osmia lignaria lignaria TaxID=1437193 RepID=UPI001478E90D|nr:uncharacterized protein LOC117603392 isoform X2 [Osmia lignaria]